LADSKRFSFKCSTNTVGCIALNYVIVNVVLNCDTEYPNNRKNLSITKCVAFDKYLVEAEGFFTY